MRMCPRSKQIFFIEGNLFNPGGYAGILIYLSSSHSEATYSHRSTTTRTWDVPVHKLSTSWSLCIIYINTEAVCVSGRIGSGILWDQLTSSCHYQSHNSTRTTNIIANRLVIQLIRMERPEILICYNYDKRSKRKAKKG